MKKIFIPLLALLLSAAAAPGGEEGPSGAPGPHFGPGHRGGPAWHGGGPMLPGRFDTDGDGTLSDEERAAARESIERRVEELRTRLLEQLEAEADGTPQDGEGATLPPPGFAPPGMLRRGPRGGPGGAFGPADRERAREGMKARIEGFRERILDEFDTDGDGVLSEEERTTARESMMERFKGQGPGGPGGGGPGAGPGGGQGGGAPGHGFGQGPGAGCGHGGHGGDGGAYPDEGGTGAP